MEYYGNTMKNIHHSFYINKRNFIIKIITKDCKMYEYEEISYDLYVL